MVSLSMATKKEIADAMGKETSITISPAAITELPDVSSGMHVFAAQLGSMTMLCWRQSNGECTVQKVNW